MLTYVKNKLLKNKWMTISLLIGNILLIAIAACSPIYSDAVLQKLLQNQLQSQMTESSQYPGTIEIRGSYTTVGLGKADFGAIEQLEAFSKELAGELQQPLLYETTEYFLPNVKAVHEGETATNAMSGFSVRIEGMENMEDHIVITAGSFPAAEVSEDRVVEVIVPASTMMNLDLSLGEVLPLSGAKNKAGEIYYARVVGVFETDSSSDPYWNSNPNQALNYLYMNFAAFRKTFVYDETERQGFNECFYVTMDYTALRGTDVNRLVELFNAYTVKGDAIFNRALTVRMLPTLLDYQISADHLTSTLLVLQVPIFLLLAAFIFMVSGQMISIDQSEISMIKSRGASRGQIMTIYFMQSAILVLIALIAAVPLGFLICQVIGSANAFLEFVQRRALSTRMSLQVVLYSLLAAAVSIVTMLIPAISQSRVGIVEAKRSKHKQSRPLWQKMFLDVLLLGISLYGLYSYNHQAAFLADSLQKGGALDPLLYMCSSMFILGCAMFFVRIFPLLVRLVFGMFKKLWSPGMYASFLRILRSRGNQSFIMIFLVLTMAMGIFSAETARTINSNAEEMIRYSNGADIVVREGWNSRQIGDESTSYVEPQFRKYEEMEGPASVTKVFVNSNIHVTANQKKLQDVTLMGIHTKEFGETAYFKDGLLNGHWYNYLNAMSQDTQGVLLSTSFRDDLGVKLGDRIIYSGKGRSGLTGIVYGFVDYWPSLTPPSAAGEGESRYFVIGNLNYMQSEWGVEPYQVWMKNAESSSQYIYDFAAETETSFVLFKDTNADLIALKNDPVFQATNGILTVGFIVVLLLCSVGFLIYWILSIRSRQLQFGIFRAMGMSMGEILMMLLNEQVWLSLLSIVMGALVGKGAAALYVPLIEMAFSSEKQLIPLEVVSVQADATKLYIVVGAVMILCMFILGRLIKKIKIAQALKLGED